MLNNATTESGYAALKFQANFARHLVVVGRQKFWDFANLIYNAIRQMPTYNELYIDRIFCHYIPTKITFL